MHVFPVTWPLDGLCRLVDVLSLLVANLIWVVRQVTCPACCSLIGCWHPSGSFQRPGIVVNNELQKTHLRHIQFTVRLLFRLPLSWSQLCYALVLMPVAWPPLYPVPGFLGSSLYLNFSQIPLLKVIAHSFRLLCQPTFLSLTKIVVIFVGLRKFSELIINRRISCTEPFRQLTSGMYYWTLSPLIFKLQFSSSWQKRAVWWQVCEIKASNFRPAHKLAENSLRMKCIVLVCAVQSLEISKRLTRGGDVWFYFWDYTLRKLQRDSNSNTCSKQHPKQDCLLFILFMILHLLEWSMIITALQKL